MDNMKGQVSAATFSKWNAMQVKALTIAEHDLQKAPKIGDLLAAEAAERMKAGEDAKDVKADFYARWTPPAIDESAKAPEGWTRGKFEEAQRAAVEEARRRRLNRVAYAMRKAAAELEPVKEPSKAPAKKKSPKDAAATIGEALEAKGIEVVKALHNATAAQLDKMEADAKEFLSLIEQERKIRTAALSTAA